MRLSMLEPRGKGKLRRDREGFSSSRRISNLREAQKERERGGFTRRRERSLFLALVFLKRKSEVSLVRSEIVKKKKK